MRSFVLWDTTPPPAISYIKFRAGNRLKADEVSLVAGVSVERHGGSGKDANFCSSVDGSTAVIANAPQALGETSVLCDLQVSNGLRSTTVVSSFCATGQNLSSIDCDFLAIPL